MRRQASIFLGSAALIAAPASAQMPTVAPDQAVEAVKDCASATVPGRVKTLALEERGWAAASIKSEGEAVETPLRIYSKGKGSALIMTSEASDASSKGCLVSGRLRKWRSFEALKAAFDEAFGNAGAKDGDHYFRVGKDVAVLSQTGSKREPSFRVTVIELGEDN